MQSSRGRVRVECTSNGFGPGNLGLRVLEASSPPTHPLCTSLGKAGQQENPGLRRDTSLDLVSRDPSLPLLWRPSLLLGFSFSSPD